MTGTLAIIDTNNFVHRAYHVSQKDKVDGRGRHIGAVPICIEMIWRVIGTGDIGDITHIVSVFDGGGRNHRHEMFPAYKANRPPQPETLTSQMALCQEAVSKMGVQVLSLRNQEADDVIATLAWTAKQQGMNATIISPDKDFMQLGDESISLFDPRPDEFCRIRPEDIAEQWGVLPSQMIDYQAICGDAVDNVPGVSRVGDKTATALLKKFGSLDAIYDSLGEITNDVVRRASFVRQQLQICRESAYLSRGLVTLKRDIPLPNMLISDLDIGLVSPGKDLLDFLDEIGERNLRYRIARRIGYTEAA